MTARSGVLVMTRAVFPASAGADNALAPGNRFPGTHPTLGPAGKLFATVTTLDPFGGLKTEWGVVIGDVAGQRYEILHRFDNSRGAQSWRRSHPHPVFSPDDQRLDFNVSSSPWTQLFVAEGKP